MTDLSVKIGADLAEIRRDFAALRGEFVRLSRSAVEAGAGMSAAFGRTLVAGAVALLTAKVAELTTGLVDGIDALNDIKDATGASVENISALEDVAARTGTSLDTVSTALTKLNRDLTQATPDSEIAANLKAIGLNAEELKRIDPAEALLRVAQALARYADDGNKARIVQALFGKSVQEVGPFLKDLAEKGQLNATVTTQQADEAERFNKQLFELSKNVKDAARSIVSDLVPALNGLFDKAKSEGFLALFGFDKEFKAKRELAAAAEEVLRLNRQATRLKNGLENGFYGPQFQAELDAVNVKLAAAKARFKALDQAQSDAAPKTGAQAAPVELAQDTRPSVTPPEDPAAAREAAAKREAARKAAEAARKAQLRADLEAQERLTKDAGQRALDILKEDFDAAKLATADYYAQRQRIELDAIDLEIAIERQKAAAGGVERAKALAEIELLERQKNDIRRKAGLEEAADRKVLERQLADAQIQLLEQQGQSAQAAALRIDAQFAELRARMLVDGNATGLALIDRLINTGKATANFDQIKAEFDRALAELARRREEIAAQVQVGAITPAVGREQEDAARQGALTKAADAIARLQALASDPAALPAVRDAIDEISAAFLRLESEGLSGFDAAAADLRAQLAQMDKSFAQQATGAGVDAFTGLFTDLVNGTKSGSEALKDFVRGFVASMAQIAARALATFLVLQLLDAVYPGLGRATAATMSVGANVKHSGGMAGHGTRRQVPGWVFAGAPRYHNGGDVGLKPGEVPAILQEGERVQSRAEVRAERQGGQGRMPTPIVVFGEDELANALAGKAGERVVVHHVRNNRRLIDG